MIDKTFYDWIKEIAEYKSFLNTLTITSRQMDEQYHLELVLRFLILKDTNTENLKRVPDVSDYITKEIKAMASNPKFDRFEAKKIFTDTFDLLDKALSDNAFRKYQNNKYTGGFSLSIYEVIALGLGFHIADYDGSDSDISKIETISKELQINPKYLAKSGSGNKASDRLPHILPLGRELFKK